MTGWDDILGPHMQAPYFLDMMQRIQQEREQGITVYPPADDVFNALKFTPLAKVRVVILGQDPYHGPGQAHGLSFSVPEGNKVPPSLVNIYKELAQDIEGFVIPAHGNLTAWAKQGTLLLNTALTVQEGKANSHAKYGWHRFTDAIISAVNEHTSGTVFLLWGSHAQRKGEHIDSQKHHVLSAPHPSPLSAHRGFFGCGHLSQTNKLLVAQGDTPINWQL